MTQSDFNINLFDLSNDNHSYKGILFSEVDIRKIFKDMGAVFSFYFPPSYNGKLVAVIWTDDKGIWHSSLRIKVPSGKILATEIEYKKEFLEGINVNETYVLNDLYKIPMDNKNWCKNENGSADGIVKIIQNSGIYLD